MSRELADSVQLMSGVEDENTNKELLCFRCSSEEKCNVEKSIKLEELELFPENTRENIINVDAVKATSNENQDMELHLENTSETKTPKSVFNTEEGETKPKNKDLKKILQDTLIKEDGSDKIETKINENKELKIPSENTKYTPNNVNNEKDMTNKGKIIKLPTQDIQESTINADKVEEMIKEDKEVKSDSQNIQETSTNINKGTINKDQVLKLSSQNIQECINAGKVGTNKNSQYFLQDAQKGITESNTLETTKNGDEEFKKLQDEQETIADGDMREMSISTKRAQEKVIDSDKTEKSTYENRELELNSKNTQERDNKSINYEINPKIQSNNFKNGKFFILLKNIPKTFHNIKQNITTKIKTYKNKRKEKKEAIKLEKELLKNIPKTEQKSPYEYKITKEQEWFRNQYAKYIGMPKIIDTNPSFVLGYLRMKAHCRYVPEAKLNCGNPEPTDSVFLSWNGPQLPRCTCPHTECFCRGDMVLKPEKLPSGGYDWSPMMYYLQWLCCFRMFLPKPCTKDFINKLVTITNAEEERYQTLHKRGVLKQMAPELCLLRCQHYKMPGDNRMIQCLPIELKEQIETLKEQDFAQRTDIIDEEKDDRVCNAFSCTVSSQTDTGPDGEIIVGKITHFVFASIKDSVLSDIEGKKLQISPCEREYNVPDIPLDEVHEVSFRKIENLFSMKEIKSRISKLISSIIVIKDPGIPVDTRAVQFPSCGKFCKNTMIYKRCNTSKFEIPSLPKFDNSFMKDSNKHDNVDDQSSCMCCKLYKESLSTNVDNKLSKN